MRVFEQIDNTKDPKYRDYCSMVVFGDLGRGKSTWLRQFATMYYEMTDRKVLVCDPSESRAFDGFKQITLAEIERGVEIVGTKVVKWKKGIRVLRGIEWTKDDWFLILQNHFANGLVILDESRDFFKPSGITPIQKRLFTIHRNRCIDVLLVSHNFMDLPLNIRKQFRIYIAFQTGDKPLNESWFTTRTLPESLYHQWLLLSRLYAPASRISPYIWYDTLKQQSVLYIDPAQHSKTFVTIRQNPVVQVTYANFISKKLKIQK